MRIKKWEYYTECTDWDDVDATLTEMGCDGWELIAAPFDPADGDGNGLCLIFKRPKVV